jgi:putative membrane protein
VFAACRGVIRAVRKPATATWGGCADLIYLKLIIVVALTLAPKGDTVMLKQLSALPFLAFFTLTQPLHAIAQQTQPPTTPPGYYWPGPWHMWSDVYGWPHWWIGPLMMMSLVIFCVAMMFFMMRGRHRHRSDYALDILKERFARGEINQAEYEERRRLLEA